MYDLDIFDVIAVFCYFLLLIEQPFFWFKGSYIYRFGLVVSSINPKREDSNKLFGPKERLSVSVNYYKKEIYIRPTIGMGVLAMFFISTIYHDNKSFVIKIKTGPLTFISFVYLMLFGLVKIFFYPIGIIERMLFVVILPLFLYIQYKLVIQRIYKFVSLK